MTGGKLDVGQSRSQSLVVPASKRPFVAEPKGRPMPSDTGFYGLEGGSNETPASAVPKVESQDIASSKEQPNSRKTASDEPVYFCGAMTKKGKPCSRRVKSNQRCWQHAGQPSALPARKIPEVF